MGNSSFRRCGFQRQGDLLRRAGCRSDFCRGCRFGCGTDGSRCGLLDCGRSGGNFDCRSDCLGSLCNWRRFCDANCGFGLLHAFGFTRLAGVFTFQALAAFAFATVAIASTATAAATALLFALLAAFGFRRAAFG